MSGGVATRLIALGYRPISVPDPQTAAARLDRESAAVRAAIVPTQAEFLTPGALWRLARAHGPSSLRVIALGPRVSDARADELRRAGVRSLVWEPCTDRELRFAVNRALHGEHGQSRLHPRAATDLVARIRVGAREKAGLVYSISANGCYVETERPCMPESYVSVHLPLPDGGVEVPARVLYVNVPGDFARHNLPHGMALAFLPAGSARERVAAYVGERLGVQGVPARGDDAVQSGGMARVWARLRALMSAPRARADAAPTAADPLPPARA
jgi:hypothetical protein